MKTEQIPNRDERIARAKEMARAEAAARREHEAEADRPVEIDGRGGKEPTRFGDWEVKGLASDF